MFRLKKTAAFSMLLFALLFFSCEKITMRSKTNDSPLEVYDAMWKVLDEKYAYFSYKELDWDALGKKHREKLHRNSSVKELYDACGALLYELQDGHVNLFAGFNYARNWSWYLGWPQNFNSEVVERNYLGGDYWISGGLEHTFLKNSKVGYVRYSSFNSSIAYFDLVLERFKNTEGIIIDVRDNGGGSLDNSQKMACHLADKKRLALQTLYKTGPGHDDFSKPEQYYIEPVNGEIFGRPVIILTNRLCFSATSFFVAMARQIPNVTVLGDTTGGGAGLPVDYMLPNGWRLRFSGNRSLDAEGNDFELGTPPDIQAGLDPVLIKSGVDSMIEQACSILTD